MKNSTIKFAAVIIAILLTLPLIKAHAQQTKLENVYLDNNGNITLSWLSDSPAQISSLNGLVLDTAAIAAEHYPVYGQVKVTTENGLYRVTVWNIFFQTERLAIPVESFAKKGRKKLRNEKAVAMLERQLRSKFIK